MNKHFWIRRIFFGKVKWMCADCRKAVSADQDMIKRMIYCPYCGKRKEGLKE